MNNVRVLAVSTGAEQRILFLWNTDSHWYYLPAYELHVPETAGLLEETMGLGH